MVHYRESRPRKGLVDSLIYLFGDDIFVASETNANSDIVKFAFLGLLMRNRMATVSLLINLYLQIRVRDAGLNLPEYLIAGIISGDTPEELLLSL